MALMGLFLLNSLFNLTLIIIESIILIGFFFNIYARNKNEVLKPLIGSLTLFLLSNILSLIFYEHLFTNLVGLVNDNPNSCTNWWSFNFY